MASVELLQYWAIIRRWLHLIVFLALVAAASALVFSLRTPPVYQATSVVLIQQATGNNVVVDYASVLTNERLAETYAQLLTTRPVLEETLQRLGLEGRLDAGALKNNVRVTPVRNTSLLRISVEDVDPRRAVDLANTIPVVFSDYIANVQTERFQESKRSLQDQLQRLQREISDLQAQIAELRQRDGDAAPEILPLQTQLTTLQSSYADLYRQYEEVRLAEARAQDTVVLTEPALYAIRVRPQTFRNTLMALMVGLMLGVGAAFLIEYLDDTVKTPADIQAVADVPVLAGIARVQDEQKLPLIAATDRKSPVTEAFRILRTNIQFAGVDKPIRSLVITSPGQGEGKSFITANLALVMAQQGHRVIVVDADLRRPLQHKLFGVPRRAGLADVLLDPVNISLDDALHPTDAENLWVLPSGQKAPNPAELLGSQRMQDLIQALAERADVVIYDTPPLLPVTDASALAKHADGVLLITQVGKTRQPVLYQTLADLRRMDIRVIGVVLNMLPPKGSRYYAYYYYYSHYYYYYPDGEHESATRRWRLWPRRRHRSRRSARAKETVVSGNASPDEEGG